MKITIVPTPEMATINLDGNPVTMRLWRGLTEHQTPVEVYVVSVVPNGGFDEAWEKEAKAAGLVRSRTLYAVGDHPKTES